MRHTGSISTTGLSSTRSMMNKRQIDSSELNDNRDLVIEARVVGSATWQCSRLGVRQFAVMC